MQFFVVVVNGNLFLMDTLDTFTLSIEKATHYQTVGEAASTAVRVENNTIFTAEVKRVEAHTTYSFHAVP